MLYAALHEISVSFVICVSAILFTYMLFSFCLVSPSPEYRPGFRLKGAGDKLEAGARMEMVPASAS